MQLDKIIDRARKTKRETSVLAIFLFTEFCFTCGNFKSLIAVFSSFLLRRKLKNFAKLSLDEIVIYNCNICNCKMKL